MIFQKSLMYVRPGPVPKEDGKAVLDSYVIVPREALSDEVLAGLEATHGHAGYIGKQEIAGDE